MQLQSSLILLIGFALITLKRPGYDPDEHLASDSSRTDRTVVFTEVRP